ncbi:mucin TcMUCII [Trypanosoma cruzi]|nr:mucin TcMUCII [Trypanosoma cruzi]
MQSFLFGYLHSVSLYCGDAIVPCLVPTYLHNMEVRYRKGCKTSLGINAPTEDASVYLKANPPRSGRHSGLLRSHNTNAIYASMITRICVLLSIRNPCLRPCIIKRQLQYRFREMPLLMNYDAYVTLLGCPTTTIVLLLPKIELFPGTLCVVIKRDFNSHFLSKDASDDVMRTAFDSIYSSLVL